MGGLAARRCERALRMTTIILKLALTPMLIGVASLVGRRWGPA